MNLPDAPIAHEDFFATHFFTVRDQGSPNSWGEVLKPCYIKLANPLIILNSGGGPTPDKLESSSKHPRISIE